MLLLSTTVSKVVSSTSAPTLTKSEGIVVLVIVVVGVLLAGLVVLWGRSVLDKGQTDQGSSLIRSWIAIALVMGLLIFCAATFLIGDSALRNTLFGGLIASVGAAVAFYFSSKTSDQAQSNMLKAAAISAGSSPPTVFTQASPPAGRVNSAYSYSFKVDGQPAPTIQLASGGPLPEGLALDPDGTLHGTPTIANTYEFQIVAKNVAGSFLSSSLSITINRDD